jgi:predicted nucleic acid-binding Zn ribbon protein
MHRILSTFFLLVVAIWACTSDCTSCHPALDVVNDTRHAPLASCVQCHPPESFDATVMNTGCGTDCFACHDIATMIQTPQHSVISECITCHESLQKVEFFKPPFAKSKGFELKQFLGE